MPLAVLALLALGGCGANTPGPDISQVRPTSTEPDGPVLVSGRNFRDGDVVAIDGRPAATVTWVNAQLLTVTLPATVPEGAYALEVRSTDGRHAATTLSVRAPPPAPAPSPVAHEPSEPAPPQSASAVRPQATPSPPVVTPAGTTEERKKAEERLREEQKREEEQRHEEHEREEERRREEEKERREQQRR